MSILQKSGEGEYPIHLAAKSRDINNLKLLLLWHEVNVNQLSDDGYSAIDFICVCITSGLIVVFLTNTPTQDLALRYITKSSVP